MLFCGECGKECGAVPDDAGIGPFEFWGSTGIDSVPIVQSSCCDASLFSNEELTQEYSFYDYSEDMQNEE